MPIIPGTLHILLDPSGAYLCLDFSLVCSHLDSLLTRILVSMNRGDQLKPCEDPKAWRAFFDGRVIERRERVKLVNATVDAVVRLTHEEVIMGPPLEARKVA
jgi:hypothetical protein